MGISKLCSNIKIGILRHPKRFVMAIFLGYASLWTVAEPLLAILDIKPNGYNWEFLLLYFCLSLIIAIISSYPKRRVEFKFYNTNTTVEIVFGDLFSFVGHKVISVSEFFDTKIGQPVSPRSLHGIFIEKILGGHTVILESAIDQQLVGVNTTPMQRNDGKDQIYPIGSTIKVEHGQYSYFLFALSKTDINCNAYATPHIMLEALDGLWRQIRIDGNGVEINIPLIGNGLSRIGLPPSQLLQLILISLLKATKERDLSSTIRIVLTPDVFDKIDLEIINNNWQ